MTLVLLAQAYLMGICADTREVRAPASDVSASSDLLPLTVPEVRHLLGHLIWPPSSSVILVLSWSQFRRGHQKVARFFHTKRRREAG